jgi:hypothetical protein
VSNEGGRQGRKEAGRKAGRRKGTGRKAGRRKETGKKKEGKKPLRFRASFCSLDRVMPA